MKKAPVFKVKFGDLLKTLSASPFETNGFKAFSIYALVIFFSVIFTGHASLAKGRYSAQTNSYSAAVTKDRSKYQELDSGLKEIIDSSNDNEAFYRSAEHNYNIVKSFHNAEIVEARNGGWGGGTGVMRSGQSPLFYDLYLAKKDLEDQTFIKPNLPITLFFKRVRFDRIKVEDLPEYKPLMGLLDTWQNTAPGLIRQLKNAMQEFNLSYTDIPLKRFDRVKNLPADLSVDDLVPLITYNRILGVRIYRPIWMLLGDKSRLAALIHETFRVMELKWSYGLNDSEFDTKIQKLTAILVLGNPRNYSTEQLHSYLTPLLKEEIENTDRLTANPDLAKSSKGKQFLQEEKDLKELHGNMYTIVSNWMIEMESHLKKYLQANEDYKYSIFTPWKESDKNFFEALADGISFYNMYLQERWQPSMEAYVLVDIKNLIKLAEKRPDLKVFENPNIYNCLAINDWSSDLSIKKDQSSISTQIGKSPAQSIESRAQCLLDLFGK